MSEMESKEEIKSHIIKINSRSFCHWAVHYTYNVDDCYREQSVQFASPNTVFAELGTSRLCPGPDIVLAQQQK